MAAGVGSTPARLPLVDTQVSIQTIVLTRLTAFLDDGADNGEARCWAYPGMRTTPPRPLLRPAAMCVGRGT